jgi:GxxExxY protein
MREPDKYLDNLARTVIGAAIEVHRTIGPGYLESVYHQALCVELKLQGVIFEKEFPISVTYKGELVGEGFIDIFVERRLIIELKAVEALLPVHTAQVMSYLKATKFLLALLINFNVPVLKTGIRRIVLS